jgi:hypothetical protein
MEKVGIQIDKFKEMHDRFCMYVDKAINDLIIENVKFKKPNVSDELINKIKEKTSTQEILPISFEEKNSNRKVNVRLGLISEDKDNLFQKSLEVYPKTLQTELLKMCGLLATIARSHYQMIYNLEEGKLYKDIISGELIFTQHSPTLYIEGDCPYRLTFLIYEDVSSGQNPTIS